MDKCTRACSYMYTDRYMYLKSPATFFTVHKSVQMITNLLFTFVCLFVRL